jgi:hypothetical protein
MDNVEGFKQIKIFERNDILQLGKFKLFDDVIHVWKYRNLSCKKILKVIDFIYDEMYIKEVHSFKLKLLAVSVEEEIFYLTFKIELPFKFRIKSFDELLCLQQLDHIKIKEKLKKKISEQSFVKGGLNLGILSVHNKIDSFSFCVKERNNCQALDLVFGFKASTLL